MRTLFTIALVGIVFISQAGNPDRQGAAGVGQLLINPWARSSGLANSNMSSVNGIEATYSNVAGLAFTKKTELVFTNSNYLVGSDISINAVGFSQHIGESGVIGLSVMMMSFGDNEITRTDLPEGGIGTFRPNMTNIGISYAKEFSNSIYGGFTLRIISEAISNVKAQGMCFDAGVRYVTGERDQLKFGISLKNVGSPLKYKGDGLSISAVIPDNGSTLTVEQRSQPYELPSHMDIGFSYDFLISESLNFLANGQFIANSFTQDQFGFGGELSFNNKFLIRGGYLWESKIGDEEARLTAFTGPSAGLTIQLPVGAEKETMIGLDYSYRTTNPFNGVHSIGVHIDL